MKIVAIGRSQLLYNTILLLAENGYKINGIITAGASLEYTRKEEDFKKLAIELGVPFVFTYSLDDEKVKEVCKGADIGISVNWVSVIQDEHIKWFNFGILNAHLGDLPRYRGNACPNWAILCREEEITLSIHFIEGGKLDVGRIVVQEKMEISRDVYIEDVYKWAERVIPKAFLNALNILEKDPHYVLKYASERDHESFRCYPRLPEYSYIDWNKSVEEIHRLIRASVYPYEAYTFKVEKGGIRKLYIKKSRIVTDNTKDLAFAGHILKNDSISGESWIKCGDGILAIQLCRYADESKYFAPGKRWKTIRGRLGIWDDDIISILECLLKEKKEVL